APEPPAAFTAVGGLMPLNRDIGNRSRQARLVWSSCPRSMTLAVALVVLFLPTIASRAAEPDAKVVEFFERKIRPVLAAKCYSCQSTEAEQKKKLKGGLRVDSKEALLQGGDSGPALVPGQVDESLLIAV